MAMQRGLLRGSLIVSAIFLTAPTADANAASVRAGTNAAAASDLSAQERIVRRRPPRIEIRPLPGPLRRECVAVFQERWIPQWGGYVLYPGQQCWWTRAPL